jgi:hypothetical protein
MIHYRTFLVDPCNEGDKIIIEAADLLDTVS